MWQGFESWKQVLECILNGGEAGKLMRMAF